MKPLLCVTVTGATTAELRGRRDSVGGADLVELRLDTVADPDVAGALEGRRGPVIVTCRPQWEGGRFAGSEDERHRLLAEALDLGADYVDLEWRAGFEDLIARTQGRRIVLSSHDFGELPVDLADRIACMRRTGAEVVKMAVGTRRLSDCLPLLDIARRSGRRRGLVLIGMGDQGLVTRVMPERFGSMWTYAGGESAVGQISPDVLVEQYRFRNISDNTELFGLVGAPIGHSVSPAMHNAAFRQARLDAVYLPLPAADAKDFVTFARTIGLKGASVTIPYKVALFDCVDEVYSVARRIGAVNTIRIADGRWLGDNTDAGGFLQPLGEGARLSQSRVAVLGGGGGARAVAVALASAGANLRVHARQKSQAQEVAQLVGAETGAWPPEPGSWDVLVNCTSVGMFPHIEDTPLAVDRLTGRLVYDLVYNPPVTRLMREAAQAGCQTIGGLEMLIAQAQGQFQWWTGSRPPASVMREAALKKLAEFSPGVAVS